MRICVRIPDTIWNTLAWRTGIAHSPMRPTAARHGREIDPARRRQLQADARRPLSENLAEGIALSHKLLRFAGVAGKGGEIHLPRPPGGGEGSRGDSIDRGRWLGSGSPARQPSPVQAPGEAGAGHCAGEAVPRLAPRPREEHHETSGLEMTEAEKYPILIEKAPDGGFGAWSPDLPGCVALGETIEEAEREMRAAITFHVDGLRREGEPVPEPSFADGGAYVRVAA